VEGMSPCDHFTIGVPFGRPINPVTKGDWEGKGVEPDVKVSAADALAVAEKLAGDKLATKDRLLDYKKSGGEGGIRTPDTAFDRITV
jgi:C-terminal processing protease CtpA/Prc